MSARRARGTLEDEVLATVSSATEPQTVASVLAALDGSAAYTTVMTTLVRLCDKGFLVRSRHGRGYAYALAAPTQSINAAVTARQMARLLAREGRRSDVLARFVAELEPGDDDLLRALLGEAPPADRP